MSDINADALTNFIQQNQGSQFVEDMRALAAQMIEAAHQRQGANAFVNPKSSTIVHEAGHVVVATDLGTEVKVSRVWRADNANWCGETIYRGGNMESGPHTDPQSDFRWACITIAGLLSEMVFDTENFRHGSSIDEVLLCGVFVKNIAGKTERTFVDIQTEVIAKTNMILRRNATVMRQIARRLEYSSELSRHQLRPFLTRVTRHNPVIEGLGLVPPSMRGAQQ
jgi:hypothetical protein